MNDDRTIIRRAMRKARSMERTLDRQPACTHCVMRITHAPQPQRAPRNISFVLWLLGFPLVVAVIISSLRFNTAQLSSADVLLLMASLAAMQASIAVLLFEGDRKL